MEFEYAFLLDALLEEQEQNITIDTTQIPFRTKRRQYVIIDAPGHKEFLKNMITGASRADAAVLVIAANEGVREQSRRHAYLLSLLGIKQVIVVVNKMDLADFSEERFRSIESEYREFLGSLGLSVRVLFQQQPGRERTSRSAALPTWNGMVERVFSIRWTTWKLLQRQSTCLCVFAFRMSTASTNAASSPGAWKPED